MAPQDLSPSSSTHKVAAAALQPSTFLSNDEKESLTITTEEVVAPSNDLHRGLQARQISMIALGGSIGTGIAISSGNALANGGPLGMVLGFIIMAAVCCSVMISLGELATFLPHKKGFAGYATRFVDPALGFALGWNYLFKYLIVTPNNLVAAGLLVSYWNTPVPLAAWLTIFIVAIILANSLSIKVFGEIEFWLSFFKVTALVGLIIICIAIDLGAGENGPLYWTNWKTPFVEYLRPGGVGIFLGVWSTLTIAQFAYIGTELIGVTVGECSNPRKNVPAAIRRTFLRIAVFYIFGAFVISLVVPATSPQLLQSGAKLADKAPALSPFVIAVDLAKIRILPGIINGCLFMFLIAAANSDLYIGSRVLYGLAIEGQAPAIFKKVNKAGVPYTALIFCSAFCCLSYLSCSSSSALVFSYFVNLVTVFGALTWMCILYCHIRFMNALKAQGIDRSTLPYVAPLQPYASYVALGMTFIVTLFKGFDSFIKPHNSTADVPDFNSTRFITSYIGIPIFFTFYLGYKLKYGTTLIPSHKVDLVSGIREFDDDEAECEKVEDGAPPIKWYVKLWNGA